MANDKELRFRILASLTGSDVIGKFNRDLKTANNEADGLRATYNKLSNGVKALAGAWVVKEVVSYTKSIIDLGAELDDLSEKTGVSVATLSQLKALSDVKGMPFEELAGYVKKLNTEIVEANSGNKEAISVFKSMGVEFRDSSGKMRSAGDVLNDISDRFKKMENGAGKSYLAMKLFGKSGPEFIPFLNKGSQELAKFSYGIDDDFSKRASQFNDSLKEMSVGAKNFAISTTKDILPAMQSILNAFKSSDKSDGALSQFTSGVLGGVVETLRLAGVAGNSFFTVLVDILDVVGMLAGNSIKLLRDAWDSTATVMVESGRAIYRVITGDFNGAQEIIKGLSTTAASGLKNTLDEQMDGVNQLATRYEKRWASAYETNRKLLKNSIYFGDGMEGAARATAPKADRTNRTDPNITALGKQERDRVKEFIEQQKLENSQRLQAIGDINLTALELKKVTEARKLEADAIKYARTMTKEQREELMKATTELISQREELIDLEFQMQRTFQFGARSYFRTYIDEANNAAKNTERVFSTAFTGLEDTLTNFVKTGKMNFRDFADSVISELIRISIRQAILAPIAGALSGAISGGLDAAGGTTSYSSNYLAGKTNGFATGGIMTDRGSLPLKTYASGGVARTPQLALFGEGRTPEAYVPLPDGRTIPVTMKGASGGGSVNISINIDNSGNESKESSNSSQDMKQLAGMIKASVVNVLQEQKRPGGLLAAV